MSWVHAFELWIWLLQKGIRCFPRKPSVEKAQKISMKPGAHTSLIGTEIKILCKYCSLTHQIKLTHCKLKKGDEKRIITESRQESGRITKDEKHEKIFRWQKIVTAEASNMCTLFLLFNRRCYCMGSNIKCNLALSRGIAFDAKMCVPFSLCTNTLCEFGSALFPIFFCAFLRKIYVCLVF